MVPVCFEENYDVEYIFGKKYCDVQQRDLYAVKWRGYPIEEMTWEPYDHLQEVKLLIRKSEKVLSQHIFNTQIKQLMKEKDSIKQPIKKQLPIQPNNQNTITKNDQQQKETVQTKLNQLNLTNNNSNHLDPKISLADGFRVSKLTINHGNFTTDIPIKVIKHRKTQSTYFTKDQQMVILFKIAWKQRDTGVVPKPTYHKYEEIKIKCPQILIEYYLENSVLYYNTPQNNFKYQQETFTKLDPLEILEK